MMDVYMLFNTSVSSTIHSWQPCCAVLLLTGWLPRQAKECACSVLIVTYILREQAGSNDKRFVIEEVTRALQTMADCMDPTKLLQRLLPYAAHKNPKVRGTGHLVLNAVRI